MTTRDITIKLRGDSTGAQQALRRVGQQANQTAQDMQRRFQAATQRINASFSAMRGPALVITAAAGAFAVMAQRSLAAAESIADTALQANIATGRLQELRFAADQNGSSAQAMDQALRVLRSNLGLVAQGAGGEAARALRLLGIEGQVLSGELSDTGQAFDQIVQRLQSIENPAERAAVATQLLGRGGRELAQLLDGGSASIEEATARLREMGGVLEDDLVQNGARANAEMRAMRQIIGTQFNRVILENADEFRGLSEAIGEVTVASIQATAAILRLFQDPRGAEAVEAEIERLESRLAALRLRGDGRGDIAGIQSRIQSLRALLELERARPPEDDPPTGLPIIEPVDTASVTTAIETGVTDAQPVLIDKLAAAMKEADRQRIDDEANKSAEIARFAEIAKETSVRLAEELDMQETRMSETFGNAMASGVMAAFDGNLRQFIANMLRRAAFEGLSNAFASLFTQSGGGGIFRTVASVATGGGGIGKKASGGPASGLTLVGEQGPELVNLGPMANVMTANMTRAAMNASKSTRQGVNATVNSAINIDARGAGEGVEQRIRAVLAVEGPRLQRQTVEATMQVLAGINSSRIPT